MDTSTYNLKPAVDMIMHFEGCILHAYPDPGTHGAPWTIGYGHTGPEVHPGLVITKAEAVADLMLDVTKFRKGVEALCRVDITAPECCALISFAYNVGLGALANSTLLRKLNAGVDKVEVADEFLKWTKAAGRVLPGLVTRRKEERSMFLSSAVTQAVA